MSVRAANFVDIPAIVRLLAEAHERSLYAAIGTFDAVQAKQLLARSLQRHGHMNEGGTLVLVSEHGGAVTGIMVGLLDRVYVCLAELVATDLLIYLSPSAPARDLQRMVSAVLAWGESNPKVIEARLDITEVIVESVGGWERAAEFYEQLGLERCGARFRRGFKR